MNNQTLIVILIIVLLIAVYSPIVAKAFEKEEPETEPQYIQMEATAYCYGTTRCDGKKVLAFWKKKQTEGGRNG